MAKTRFDEVALTLHWTWLIWCKQSNNCRAEKGDRDHHNLAKKSTGRLKHPEQLGCRNRGDSKKKEARIRSIFWRGTGLNYGWTWEVVKNKVLKFMTTTLCHLLWYLFFLFISKKKISVKYFVNFPCQSCGVQRTLNYSVNPKNKSRGWTLRTTLHKKYFYKTYNCT